MLYSVTICLCLAVFPGLTYIHAYHIHINSGLTCPSHGPNRLYMGERLIEEQLPALGIPEAALQLVRRTARAQSAFQSVDSVRALHTKKSQNHVLVQPWPKGIILC